MSMKSAEEWCKEIGLTETSAETVEQIRKIQRDALQAAAEICQQLKLKYMQPVDSELPPFDSEFKSGYAVGMNICEDKIHKLMEGLK